MVRSTLYSPEEYHKTLTVVVTYEMYKYMFPGAWKKYIPVWEARKFDNDDLMKFLSSNVSKRGGAISRGYVGDSCQKVLLNTRSNIKLVLFLGLKIM